MRNESERKRILLEIRETSHGSCRLKENFIRKCQNNVQFKAGFKAAIKARIADSSHSGINNVIYRVALRRRDNRYTKFFIFYITAIAK